MHFTIVTYTFPPSKEIGGRRWAKFSRYIAAKGHSVTVVCSDNMGEREWYEREYKGINVNVLPRLYPKWLSGVTNSFIERLKYAFCTRVLSLLTKQNFFDRGYAWKDVLLKEIESINRKNPIDVLVATGAPFSLLYYCAIFKIHHKNICYVSDIRDPWTWGSYYGIPTMSKRKRKYQDLLERECVEHSDMICYPTEHIGNILAKKYSIYANKLYLLPHAYEPEKFQDLVKEEKREGFIYGGTLYNGIDVYIRKLIEILNSNPDSGFSWDIYTGSTYPLLDSIKNVESIRIHAFIPEEQLFQRIQKSAAYLVFFPKSDKDIISTKFYEIIYAKTPILYIGEEGDVGKFIRENQLGVHILPENMELELPKYLSGKVPYNPGYFDIKEYAFESVTARFLSALKEYCN